ncbi:MAG: hypothetical protein JNL70_12695 [Saprospiraceae bacterium]|nr:hypothetical protein [Saprospiraceae bacterium]
MLNFCTLFDANYLARGLVTYDSLMAVTEGDAHLYVFAFDDKCYNVLTSMQLPNITVISLTEFEDEQLLAIKQTRSRGEYCWTCTSSTILYCIEKFNLSHCTYIDADMYFYQNPKILIDEKPSNCSVIITEHRYTPAYDKSKLSGKYCVQFMYFDNTKEGLDALKWWRERCLEWCYNRFEDGKFGDQKYLDDWTTRFAGVHVLRHLGGGLAPWNVQQYGFFDKNENAKFLNVYLGEPLPNFILESQSNIWGFIKDLYSNLYNNDFWSKKFHIKYFPTVFFHFHGVKLYENGGAVFAPKMYILNRAVRSIFYEPYIQKLKAAQQKLCSFDPDFDRIGFLSSKQFHEDRRKGWWGFVKTNVLNRYLGTNLN